MSWFYLVHCKSDKIYSWIWQRTYSGGSFHDWEWCDCYKWLQVWIVNLHLCTNLNLNLILCARIWCWKEIMWNVTVAMFVGNICFILCITNVLKLFQGTKRHFGKLFKIVNFCICCSIVSYRFGTFEILAYILSWVSGE